MSDTTPGYYHDPTIRGDQLLFVTDSDLWSVTTAGGQARRLTTDRVAVWSPRLSPDGQLVAFASRTEGSADIFVMPADGGVPRRLTHLGRHGLVQGWSRDGETILFGSNAAQPHRMHFLRSWRVSRDGGPPELSPLGPVDRLSLGPEGGMVIGRAIGDPARWKRYRGGRTGDLWIDRNDDGEFERLLELDGNLASPMWVGERIYFLSDHEGFGNLYSCALDGSDLQRHTEHEQFYARNASTDGTRIVYQSGGDLHLFTPEAGMSKKIDITIASSRPQQARRFVSGPEYLEGYDLHPRGHSLTLGIRGKAFALGNWEKATAQLGERHGVRYRLGRWTSDGRKIVVISDEGGEEALEIHAAESGASPRREARLDGLEIGRALSLELSPTGQHACLTNHRFELVVVDLENAAARVIDRSEHERIAGASWSPDGRWIAYGFFGEPGCSHIRVADTTTDETHPVTDPVLLDAEPRFDRQGRYLYFVGTRTFRPVPDRTHFNFGFPRGARLYAIPLRADLGDPADPDPRPLSEDDDRSDREERDAKRELVETIDFEGISGRVRALPVEEGLLGNLQVGLDRVYFVQFPIESNLTKRNTREDRESQGVLKVHDLRRQSTDVFARDVVDFRLSRDARTVAYRTRKRLRVLNARKKPSPSAPEKAGRLSGWIDLSRPRVSVDPRSEWQQMYREAWRLQRDHFWNPDMSGVDWVEIYQRYLPLLDRVSTREEFSDLLWEMQGELGTSHGYEMGGDRRRPPKTRLGCLGADLAWRGGHWVIDHVVRGDSWVEHGDSPLHAPGVEVAEGALVLAVDGHAVDDAHPPGEFLVYRAGQPTLLTVQDPGAEDPRDVTITPLTEAQDALVRYREWVERNRQHVHDASGGRVGYLHLPDMGPHGYAEFHRYWTREAEYEGLIVDVRYNGGGNVSQLLLEKLSRERLGWNIRRHGSPRPRPHRSVRGPMVAVTNEYAGSDGDIFSHSFKLMKLGPLIGRRTWGGVVGIWPRHRLVDRTVTTQAEFALWFDDVGWGVENYGTDPDIEIENRPQDWAAGIDPQLEKGIAVVLEQLAETPADVPTVGDPPDLAPPRLAPGDSPKVKET